MLLILYWRIWPCIYSSLISWRHSDTNHCRHSYVSHAYVFWWLDQMTVVGKCVCNSSRQHRSSKCVSVLVTYSLLMQCVWVTVCSNTVAKSFKIKGVPWFKCWARIYFTRHLLPLFMSYFFTCYFSRGCQQAPFLVMVSKLFRCHAKILGFGLEPTHWL